MLSSVPFQGFYLSCVDAVSTMDSGVTVVSDPVVTVRITSTICSFETEKKFMRGITIGEFKVRLPIRRHISNRICKLALHLYAQMNVSFLCNICKDFVTFLNL